MSFSQEIKNEIGSIELRARHCLIARLAGIYLMCGAVREGRDKSLITFQTDNVKVALICFTLLKKTCKIGISVCVRTAVHCKGRQLKLHKYIVQVQGSEVQQVKSMLKLNEANPVSCRLLEKECCKRAFLGGVFMSSGSIADPDRAYHFEIVCRNSEIANFLIEFLSSFGINAKSVPRRNNHVVYIKDGDQISYLLGFMEASKAYLDMENARVTKEMRNEINRKVNFEAANIGKTVRSAMRQVEDIEFIRDNGGFSLLNSSLREMAEVRLEYPEASLKDLGTHLEPPVGKSGVNHRLRKLEEIAAEMRQSIQ